MTEIAPDAETVTAILTSHMDSGENFDGAILIGTYPGVSYEIWVEFCGARTNVQCADINAFCKQLKRAAKLAVGQAASEAP